MYAVAYLFSVEFVPVQGFKPSLALQLVNSTGGVSQSLRRFRVKHALNQLSYLFGNIGFPLQLAVF